MKNVVFFSPTMSYAHRRTAVLENERLKLTILPGGGHIAAVELKPNGISPLWDPPWETIEPSQYDAAEYAEYGPPIEGKLLAGIVGHSLCFDFFGPPSEQEFAAGLAVHGEASVVDWDVVVSDGEMTAIGEFPLAGMRTERRLRLSPGSQVVTIRETAENLSAADRAVGWTQHATLGPPFLEKGKTVFHMPATSSKVFEGEFAPGHDRLKAGAEFEWPTAPTAEGGSSDLRLTGEDAVSGAYTAHLMDPSREQAWFTAFHPESKTLFGYAWRRADFPWLGIWEENYSRKHPPWRGRTLARGMEFGVSPFPEPRRAMIDRSELFGEKGYRWIPAGGKVEVEYCLFLTEADGPAETVEWGDGSVRSEGVFELKV